MLPGVEKADLAATFMVGDRVDEHLEGRSTTFFAWRKTLNRICEFRWLEAVYY